MQRCLLLCRWLTILDLLDEKVVPMGCLGTSDIVTSIHIPAIKPTHFFWSFKVSRASACCRLHSIAGTSPVDRLHSCKDTQPAAQRCRAQAVCCKPFLCIIPHDMANPSSAAPAKALTEREAVHSIPPSKRVMGPGTTAKQSAATADIPGDSLLIRNLLSLMPCSSSHVWAGLVSN